MEDLATYSPTLSMLSMYNAKADETACKPPNLSPLSTPSRPPRHPHRINAIFSPPSSISPTTSTTESTRWPLTSTTTGAATTILTTPGESTAQRHSPTAYERGFNIFTYDASARHRRGDHRISNTLKGSPTISATLVHSGSASPSKFPLPPPRHPSHTARVASKIDNSLPMKRRHPGSPASSPTRYSSRADPSLPSHPLFSPRKPIHKRRISNATTTSTTTTSPSPSPSKPSTAPHHHHSKTLSLSIIALRRMNSETNSPPHSSPSSSPGKQRNLSREHTRYISLSGIDPANPATAMAHKPERDVLREAESAHSAPPAPETDHHQQHQQRPRRQNNQMTIGSSNPPPSDNPTGEQTLRTPRIGRKWWRKSSSSSSSRAAVVDSGGGDHGRRGVDAMMVMTRPVSAGSSSSALSARTRVLAVGEEGLEREEGWGNKWHPPTAAMKSGDLVRGPRGMPLPPPAPAPPSATPTTTTDPTTPIVDAETAAYSTRLTGDGRRRSPLRRREPWDGGAVAGARGGERDSGAGGGKRDSGAGGGGGGKRDSVASAGGWRRDSMVDEELDDGGEDLDEGREEWEEEGGRRRRRRRRGRESLYDARGFLKEA